MEIHFLANDFSTLLPILVLILFFVIPYVLKMLGRYTSASRHEALHEEPHATDQPPLYEDQPGPPMRQDYDQFDRSTPSSKPITPKWF